MSFKKFIIICFMVLLSVSTLFAIVLPDGTDAIISSLEKYPDGKIKSVVLQEATTLKTPIGNLVFYIFDDFFTKNLNTEFFENGSIKSGYLSGSQKIKTPIGEFDAINYISFYESGELETFCIELGTLKTGVGDIKIEKGWGIFSQIVLYKSKKIYSISDFDDHTISVGKYSGIKIRKNITFYETGNIKSFNSSASKIDSNFGKFYGDGEVGFYENGDIEFANIKTQIFDTTFGLLSLNFFSAYQSGKFKQLNLQEAVMLPEKYSMYKFIDKNGYGKDKAEPQKITSIRFYESGALKWYQIWSGSNFVNESISKSKYYDDFKTYRCNYIWFFETGEPMGFDDFYSVNKNFENLYCFNKEGKLLGSAVLDKDTFTLISKSDASLQKKE